MSKIKYTGLLGEGIDVVISTGVDLTFAIGQEHEVSAELAEKLARRDDFEAVATRTPRAHKPDADNDKDNA